ncbi:acetyl-CoA carboxylase biotin carboxylase subunit [Stappia taiwanensis]|uniref:Acetyl-CoA carboxylase biotin carboxylase subunit n=1 Tax=Stappia taiwanensis TaxID=992267 RepID=A0A838XUK1_9HYPH|nr:acetyl-CoA carboxylase biotin carboxylase subunit [Stappia taiwanensis]MBA4610663.1 acetyl-CoA carboxylase biotin carboxylase subunit [Stappia taiwanensis]GGE83203.1 3-methylcrotonyl-CoA carboxylase subunit alpha [Stappia taiwanensis]
MLDSVLIANRGEIACRIIKTARRLGLRTIAVYSDADRQALHVRMADEAVHIGPAPSAESYLVGERILAAAKVTGAAAIHPGYGFLSENADFAEACAKAGIVFIGPSANAIRAMGLKDGAKTLMEGAGVPVVPGYHGEKQDPEFLKRKAYEIGYPVLIKAVAGGGGKGMRRVDKAIDFEAALASARREAQSAFGDPRVLIEKFILNPRHVEIQVFGDGKGEAVHLFERDCSAQRRHQKVLEEAPAPGMSAETRAAMGAAAVAAAKAVNYGGAGTVEFIADGSGPLRPDGFWFMEMNTRLQVEHPVTELVTGVDLVEWQLRVASGEGLPLAQEEIRLAGHAIEARLYAEDPDNGFLPSTGRLELLMLPEGEGIRIDTGVEAGAEVSPHYDPMIAKVIAHGATREEALERLSRQFGVTWVAGPKSNLAFLAALVDHPEVRAGGFDTGLVDRDLDGLTGGAVSEATIAAAVATLVAGHTPHEEAATGWIDPFAENDAFQLSGPRVSGLKVTVDGQMRDLPVRWRDGQPVPDGQEGDGADIPGIAAWSGDAVWALEGGRAVKVALVDQLARTVEAEGGKAAIPAPMHGKVIAVSVAAGDAVERGDRLAVVEAMKMEHAITAPRDGIVEAVLVAEGAQVDQGAPVVRLREEAEEGA